MNQIQKEGERHRLNPEFKNAYGVPRLSYAGGMWSGSFLGMVLFTERRSQLKRLHTRSGRKQTRVIRTPGGGSPVNRVKGYPFPGISGYFPASPFRTSSGSNFAIPALVGQRPSFRPRFFASSLSTFVSMLFKRASSSSCSISIGEGLGPDPIMLPSCLSLGGAWCGFSS